MKSPFCLKVLISGCAVALCLPAPAESPDAPVPAPPTGTPPAQAAADAATLAAGKTVYNMTCLACHQPTGLGLPPVIPPLKGSDWVKAVKPSRVVRVVMNGVAGPITVNGKAYNGIMPGHAAQLDDAKMAAVISYVRHEFGGGASPVSAEYIAAARKAFKDRAAPWTEKELLAVPDK